jgi:hypothetical protein
VPIYGNNQSKLLLCYYFAKNKTIFKKHMKSIKFSVDVAIQSPHIYYCSNSSKNQINWNENCNVTYVWTTTLAFLKTLWKHYLLESFSPALQRLYLYPFYHIFSYFWLLKIQKFFQFLTTFFFCMISRDTSLNFLWKALSFAKKETSLFSLTMVQYNSYFKKKLSEFLN